MGTPFEDAGSQGPRLGAWVPLIALGLLTSTTGVPGFAAVGQPTGAPVSVPPCGSAAPAADRCTRWVETVDRGGLDATPGPATVDNRDVALTVDTAPQLGLTVGAGRSQSAGGGTDPFAVSVETGDGTRRWSWVGDLGDGRDEVTDVEVDEARGQALLVVEDEVPRELADTWLVALDLADGDHRWETRLPEEQGPRTAINDLDQAPGGAVYVAGEAEVKEGHGSHDDVFLARLDPADGSIDWTTHWDGQGENDALVEVAVAPGSDRLVGGGSTSGHGASTDVLAMAVDGTDGSIAWTQRMTGPGADWDWAYDVALGPAGDRVALTALETLPSGVQRLTAALDAATGTVEWRREDPASDLGGGVRIGTHGDRALVTGSVGTAALALADGSLLWSHAFEGTRLVVGDEQAELYVGQTVDNPGTTLDCVTRALGTGEGDVRWEARYQGPNAGVGNQPGGNRVGDRCWDADLDPGRDTLLVAGDTWQPGRNADGLVLAYRQSPSKPHPHTGNSATPVDTGPGTEAIPGPNPSRRSLADE